MAADMDAIAVWFGLVLTGTVLKLSSSVDDVVWLLPFVSGSARWCNAAFYVFCMELVVGLSWFTSSAGTMVLGLFVPESDEWPLERVLELLSAVLLSLYAMKLFRDWWLERNDDDDSGAGAEGKEKTGPDKAVGLVPAGVACDAAALPNAPAAVAVREGAGSEGRNADTSGWWTGDANLRAEVLDRSDIDGAPVIDVDVDLDSFQTCQSRPDSFETCRSSPDRPGGELPDALDIAQAEPLEHGVTPSAEEVPAAAEAGLKKRQTLCSLFTVCMLGSLDDFAIQVSILLSGVFSGPQLLAGVFLGSVIVLIVCLGAGAFQYIVCVLERIPLWAIIGAFATWTYVSVFVMS